MKEWKILTAKRRARLMRIIVVHRRYRKCYFWTVRDNAASRRRQEFDNKYEFIWKGQEYEIDQSLSISCKNFYFSTSIHIDGKKSNITALERIVGIKQ